MLDGFRQIDLRDREQGPVYLCVVTPKDGDSWGVLSPIQNTPWATLVQAVSGEALSHALHGWATPLIREMGPHPHAVAKRITTPCALSKNRSCAFAGALCKPGPWMPSCYEPPDMDTENALLINTVLLALKEERFVIRVVGSEFVLT
jgi:hypothetical protein